MDTLLLFGFFGSVVLVFLHLYYTFLRKEKDINNFIDATGKWKIGLIFVILAVFFWSIYLTSSLLAVGSTEFLTQGSDVVEVTSNAYEAYYAFMPFINLFLLLNVILSFVDILKGFEVFGRPRMSGFDDI